MGHQTYQSLIFDEGQGSVSEKKDPRPPLGAQFFDNQIPLMNVTEFCSRFGYSKKTIYDWKYRPKKNRIPDQMVVKIRGKLFVRTDIFKNLIPF